jgi:ATP-dependent DNA helicase Rep
LSLKKLNPRQLEAVRAVDGHVLVLAGAGSGKTSVITHKIAHLINDHGIAPKHIAAVTFTNKAAREMRTRVGAIISREQTRSLTISTFHTLGLSIIRKECGALGFKPGFSIFDAEDSLGLIRELMRSDFSADKKLAEQVQWQISRWKNELAEPDSDSLADEAIARTAARVYPEYLRHLKAYNAVDFDDLIRLPVLLFRQQPEILQRWRSRYRYLLIDEYQDTNSSQYELVRQLVGGNGAMTVVGDDDQSIYTWRGAQPENLKYLQRDFPGLQVIKLEQNYRSTGRILHVANTLIANNEHVFDKRLWSDFGYGDPVTVLHTNNEIHEVEKVVGALQRHQFRHRTHYRDYAILFRSNHQARIFERTLREHRIPYFLSGSLSFFDRTEIKDILAYLRLITNPDDDNAFLRIVNTPRREIGPATLERLGSYATERGVGLLKASNELGLEQHMSARQLTVLRAFTQWVQEMVERAVDDDPIELAKRVIADTHYGDWLQETCNDTVIAEKRMENVMDLLDWLRRMAERDDENLNLSELVAKICLIGMLESDGEEEATDHVFLMTLHAAKGLEFPHVFIAGFEEGILPHHASLDEDRLSEERRLAYVGITRAMKTLTLSFCNQRKRQGELVDCAPSRFLSELPEDDLTWEGKDHALPVEEKQERGRAYLESMRELLGNEN